MLAEKTPPSEDSIKLAQEEIYANRENSKAKLDTQQAKRNTLEAENDGSGSAVQNIDKRKESIREERRKPGIIEESEESIREEKDKPRIIEESVNEETTKIYVKS